MINIDVTKLVSLFFLFLIWILLLGVNNKLDTLIELIKPPADEQIELNMEDLETGAPLLMIG